MSTVWARARAFAAHHAAAGEMIVGDGEGTEADSDQRLTQRDAHDIFFDAQGGHAGLIDEAGKIGEP